MSEFESHLIELFDTQSFIQWQRYSTVVFAQMKSGLALLQMMKATLSSVETAQKLGDMEAELARFATTCEELRCQIQDVLEGR